MKRSLPCSNKVLNISIDPEPAPVDNLLQQCLVELTDYPWFQSLLRDSYCDSKNKMDSNRQKNQKWKKKYLWIMRLGLLIPALAFAIYLYCYFKRDILNMEDTVKIFAVFFSIGIIISGYYLLVVARSLSIYKYQETWARHAKCYYSLRKEMILFLESQEPYDTALRTDVFMRNCLAILTDNINHFCDNMENKEAPLLNEVDFISKLESLKK